MIVLENLCSLIVMLLNSLAHFFLECIDFHRRFFRQMIYRFAVVPRRIRFVYSKQLDQYLLFTLATINLDKCFIEVVPEFIVNIWDKCNHWLTLGKGRGEL
ncbi:hypothetical protein WI73_13090 [Burkholderia ubonensis]|nr:hypothetical protein WI73_13090 [Burkholderia ubonensis]